MPRPSSPRGNYARRARLHVPWRRSSRPQGWGAASRLTHEWLGTINTAILLTSSLTMALAVRSGWANHRRPAIKLLWATAVLGAAFIGVKLTEYGLE